MRILWYGKWDNVDGNHVYMKTLSAMQADNGHRVIVAFLGDDHTNLEDRHPEITYLPLPYLYKTQPWTLSHPAASVRFRKIVEKYQPDLVHASLAVSSFDLFMPEICRKKGIVYIATFHISFANHWDRFSICSYLNHLFYKRTLMSASRVISFSAKQREYLRTTLKIPSDRLEVIPNGVDSDLYTPGPSKFRQNMDADVVVGYFGRLAPEKNVGKLCRAFLDVADPKSYLVIMGKGVSERKLKRKYGDHPRIVFTGYRASNQEKIDILRAFDIFVLPSSIEGLSLSLLEAMSCAVPPIVTDVGGNAGLASDCGIVVDPRCIRIGVREALGRLRGNPQLLKSIGESARRKVQARFSWEDNYASLERIYNEVIAGHLRQGQGIQ
jgi:glycosyltransferase involved in cell wall biosynthesis